MADPRFKPGDLALIIGGSRPQNIGKCVELVELVLPGGIYRTSAAQWVENVTDEPVWHVVGDGVQGSAGIGYCQKVERNLMPLRGDGYVPLTKASEVPA